MISDSVTVIALLKSISIKVIMTRFLSFVLTSRKHTYIILTPLNWGLQGYTLFFLFLLKNIDCGYSLEPPREAVLTSTHNLCFEQKYEKN